MRLTLMCLAFALAAAPAVAPAQPQSTGPAPAACAATDAALPVELSAWTAKTPLAAATKPTGLDQAQLSVGHAVAAALPTTADVTYVNQPDKPGGTVSHGGLFGLTIAEAGTYRIALSAAPWIDVLQDGKAVFSNGHTRGPECSTVRKIVDFPLQPGRYVIQVSANGDAALGLMVARKP